MKITFVKKILADGSACKKCIEVEKRLQESQHMDRIDSILVADVRDPSSPGMLMASQYHVDRAPFFLVQHDDGREVVYTIYFKFVKEVLEQETNDQKELEEILDNNSDLDFL